MHAICTSETLGDKYWPPITPERVGGLQRELLLVWLLLVVTVVATFTIQRFRITALPPSGAAMIIGILVGGAVRLAGMSLWLYCRPSLHYRTQSA